MRIVHLCRHATAAEGEPDELRELTPQGVEQARALGRLLATSPDPPAIVLTSPLVRARQTAELLARETGAELRIEPLLAPGAAVDELRARSWRGSTARSRPSATSRTAPRSRSR